MIASRGITFMELDERASEADKPYGIITADCSGAHEYDDGILVRPLPTATESYEVSVFAVDTSQYYHDEAVLRQALRKTESKYHNPFTGQETYEPMLDQDLTQSLHFAQGAVRKALVVSFLVGEDLAPTNPTVSFGQVEVVKNYRYDKFGTKCRYSEREYSYGRAVDYGRAAAFMLEHVNADYFKDEEAASTGHEGIYQGLMHVPSSSRWQRGSNINQAFMVTANHMVAKLMREEDRLAIYRVHSPGDDSYAELLSPELARYSTTPDVHEGLGLDVYTRVTSPLRRVEDFVMHGLLKARSRGLEESSRDVKRTNQAVQRLNLRIAAEEFQPPASRHSGAQHYRRLASAS